MLLSAVCPRPLLIYNSRDQKSLEAYYKQFTPEERQRVEAVAMDMWDLYLAATKAYIPDAHKKIVFDRFHVMQHVLKAVDIVRKQEHKALSEKGNTILKGTKYLWLMNPDNWSKDDKSSFRSLAVDELKVGKAWAIKESFRHFWDYSYAASAEMFFKSWHFWATHSRLRPVIDAAKTLKRHADGIFAYLKHHITNAVSESLNSKIQSIKADARGFRNFKNYRIAILFHCGKLNLYP